MKLRKTLLATSVGAALAIGIVGEAAASIYAGSKINLQNLQIQISGNIAQGPGSGLVTSYNFDLQNTASLTPGGNAFTTNTCNGGAALTPCVPTQPGLVTPGDILYAGPAEVGIALGNQAFGFVGPNSGLQYARSDSVISDAQLAGDTFTNTTNIAEAELVDGTAGSGQSTVQSTSGLSFTFTAEGPGVLNIQFDANPDLLASIQDPPPGGAATATALASHSAQVKLTQDNTPNQITWDPSNVNNANSCQGGVGTDGDVVISGVGISCLVEISPEDLNNDVAASTLPTSQDCESFPGIVGCLDPGLQSYQFTVAFTTGGTYTLGLTESKSVLVSRTQAAPEPGTLLLLGTGAAFAGLARRRAKKKSIGKAP